MRLVIKPSTVKNKKYTAIFYDGDKKVKTLQFGDSRYSDYTQSKDKKQRDRYRARHKGSLEKTNFQSPAHLSYYILWGDSSNIKTNISKYKKRFNLK
tara:strand:+ start:629 stop:919 length:291 start_codon:yes stop_codon:yes gene_type:complete